jgi:hypothetical protein
LEEGTFQYCHSSGAVIGIQTKLKDKNAYPTNAVATTLAYCAYMSRDMLDTMRDDMTETLGPEIYQRNLWKLCIKSVLMLNYSKFQLFIDSVGEQNIDVIIKDGEFLL